MRPSDLFGVAARAIGLWMLANAVAVWVLAPTEVRAVAVPAIVGAILLSRGDQIARLVYDAPRVNSSDARDVL